MSTKKVHSLYHVPKEGVYTYIASFPTREKAVEYGKDHFDAWQCDIVVEHISKEPYINTNPNVPGYPILRWPTYTTGPYTTPHTNPVNVPDTLPPITCSEENEVSER